MSLFRRKPAPDPPEGTSWAPPGTGKHARAASSPGYCVGPALPPAAAAPGSHRASEAPPAPSERTADQA